jgi:hypothetical protein
VATFVVFIISLKELVKIHVGKLRNDDEKGAVYETGVAMHDIVIVTQALLEGSEGDLFSMVILVIRSAGICSTNTLRSNPEILYGSQLAVLFIAKALRIYLGDKMAVLSSKMFRCNKFLVYNALSAFANLYGLLHWHSESLRKFELPGRWKPTIFLQLDWNEYILISQKVAAKLIGEERLKIGRERKICVLAVVHVVRISMIQENGLKFIPTVPTNPH